MWAPCTFTAGPSLNSLPSQTLGEAAARSPGGNFPLKNQSGGRGLLSCGGDGDMLPTLEPKTPRPSLKGDRRYGTEEAATRPSGLFLLEKPKWSDPHQHFLEVGRGVGRCAAKTAGGLKHPPWSTAAQSKCAKSHQLPLGTNTPGVATRMLGPICTRLTGDLPQGRGYLP